MNVTNSFFKGLLLLFILTVIQPRAIGQENVFPEHVWGVYSWANYNPKQITPTKTPNVKGGPIILHWSRLEPKNGKFKFDALLGAKLKQLHKDSYYTSVMVWVAPATRAVTVRDTVWGATPKWLFHEGGVPLVAFESRPNPLGKSTTKYFPYYLHDNYKFYFHRMIAEFGKYIKKLPNHLSERILFVQCAEGSTGDGQPYKGKPINSQYNITHDQWSAFRIETWEKYVEALSKDEELLMPMLTNYDSNGLNEYDWMLNKLPNAIGLKNGMFSHGYHISDAQERLVNFTNFRNAVEAQGKVFFARGEMDAEYATYGWSTQNIPQALYWSGIYATHCGLSLWNVPTKACQDPKNQEALMFFNRYAAQFHPKTAKRAFCALRKGLDAADINEFPEDIYGKAKKSNVQRYINITNAFSDYGARMGDVEKSLKGGMMNRKRKDYNDAGWKILTGNYQRHITQIDAEETSAAWWQIDASIYGRFARGFEPSDNQNTMYFDIDDNFFSKRQTREKSNIKLKVVYRDADPGSWSLKYHAKDGSMKTAFSIKNSGSRSGWKSKEIIIGDALFNNGGDRGADLILQNDGNTNCRFHLIEVELVKTTH